MYIYYTLWINPRYYFFFLYCPVSLLFNNLHYTTFLYRRILFQYFLLSIILFSPPASL
jgi:hypothetical protein